MQEVAFDLILEDLPLLETYIGSHIEVTTVDKEIHKGYMYVIDPISKIVVITSKNKNQMEFINSEGIKCFKIDLQDKIEFAIGEKGGEVNVNVEERRRKLKRWLKQNLIEVEEDGVKLRYQDYLIIEPPYTTESCYCSNTIVLDKIIKLMQSMPIT